MGNGRVDADPESIRRVAGALTQYQKDVSEVASQVEGALKDALWQDPQRDQFEDWFKELRKKVASLTGSEVSDIIRRLAMLAQHLEDIHGGGRW
jgi:thiamine pyrophosphate-dependent acetolactate synthase large subunit-like protein